MPRGPSPAVTKGIKPARLPLVCAARSDSPMDKHDAAARTSTVILRRGGGGGGVPSPPGPRPCTLRYRCRDRRRCPVCVEANVALDVLLEVAFVISPLYVLCLPPPPCARSAAITIITYWEGLREERDHDTAGSSQSVLVVCLYIYIYIYGHRIQEQNKRESGGRTGNTMPLTHMLPMYLSSRILYVMNSFVMEYIINKRVRICICIYFSGQTTTTYFIVCVRGEQCRS